MIFFTKKIVLIIIGSFFLNFYLNAEIPEDSQLAYSINFKVYEVFKKKFGLTWAGVRLGGPKKINLMGLILNTDYPLNKDECRRLIINCTEEYLSAINCNSEIQKYLCCSPFPLQNIHIDIQINDENNDIVIFPKLSVVSARHGKIEYMSYYYKDDLLLLKLREEESYEDAVKIVHEQCD